MERTSAGSYAGRSAPSGSSHVLRATFITLSVASCVRAASGGGGSERGASSASGMGFKAGRATWRRHTAQMATSRRLGGGAVVARGAEGSKMRWRCGGAPASRSGRGEAPGRACPSCRPCPPPGPRRRPSPRRRQQRRLQGLLSRLWAHRSVGGVRRVLPLSRGRASGARTTLPSVLALLRACRRRGTWGGLRGRLLWRGRFRSDGCRRLRRSWTRRSSSRGFVHGHGLGCGCLRRCRRRGRGGRSLPRGKPYAVSYVTTRESISAACWLYRAYMWSRRDWKCRLQENGPVSVQTASCLQ